MAMEKRWPAYIEMCIELFLIFSSNTYIYKTQYKYANSLSLFILFATSKLFSQNIKETLFNNLIDYYRGFTMGSILGNPNTKNQKHKRVWLTEVFVAIINLIHSRNKNGPLRFQISPKAPSIESLWVVIKIYFSLGSLSEKLYWHFVSLMNASRIFLDFSFRNFQGTLLTTYCFEDMIV